MTNAEYENVPDDFPYELYAKKEQYVQLAMKHMTAKRMVGWLREYADYCDFAGNDTTAIHARSVSNQLERQVENLEHQQ